MSGETVVRLLRVLGVCFALISVYCFAASRRAAPHDTPPRIAIEPKE
jgi:hypothetical protein